MQIANQLSTEIHDGVYRRSQMLPTEREIMERFSVSRQTVRQALSILVSDGLIEKRQGSGSHILEPQATRQNKGVAIVTTYINDYIFPTILRDVENVLSRKNYATMIFSTENKVGVEREVLTDLLRRPLDGLLVEGSKTALPNPNLDLYRRFQDQGIPIVFIHGCYADLPNQVLVADDNFGGGYQLTSYLIEKGHTHIGSIFKSDDIQGQQRYAGFLAALRDSGLPIPDDRTLWYSTELRDLMLLGDDAVLNFYIDCLLMDCTAVVCYTDEVAYRLLSVLPLRGIRV
ncbi:MAG: GntR family transcriptional regulator, partial [Clostridiales bacterium]|nr:GntR family transcriptional regulator [Clostridiales bacterium]